MLDDVGMELDPLDAQREEQRRKQREALESAALEREEHQAQLRAVAEERSLELGILMEDLKEPERRAIRLEAMKVALTTGLLSAGSSHPQTILDDLTLRIARYAVKGEA